MISPPVCINKKCKNYFKYEKNSLVKVIKTKNTFLCKECKKEFKWSIPKEEDGIVY